MVADMNSIPPRTKRICAILHDSDPPTCALVKNLVKIGHLPEHMREQEKVCASAVSLGCKITDVKGDVFGVPYKDALTSSFMDCTQSRLGSQ
mmetsp:Transcript_6650/g.18169  ORF Transcript_6650/g.18169 Transcript_6650/m.18169 type:complete len:92 (+) Transcript_6650:1961-2236(+)